MAGGGVGEAMLIGAAVGAGTGGVMSAVKDEDPLQGALLGAAMGAAGGGIGSAVGGAGSALTQTGAQAAGTGSSITGAGFQNALGQAMAQGGEQAATTSLLSQAGSGATQMTPGLTQAALGGGSNIGSMAGQGAMSIPGIGSTTGGMTGVGATAGGAGGSTAPWGAQGLGQGFAPSLTNAQAYGAGVGGGIMGLVGQNAQNQNNMAQEPETYTGPLSQFKYSPKTFRPSVAPGYADGGVASLGRQAGMYPQSQYDKTQFATPSQMPISREVIGADFDRRVDPFTGDIPRYAGGGIGFVRALQPGGEFGAAQADIYGAQENLKPSWLQKAEPGGFIGSTVPGKMDYEDKQRAEAQASAAEQAAVEEERKRKEKFANFLASQYGLQSGESVGMARGGISSLGSYSDGGRMLRGPGDGMSDDIPGVIGGKQPARLADGEFVVPADVVSHLGNGSTDAGAKKLYGMMDNVRKARTGSKKQGKQIKADKYVPGYADGGVPFGEAGYDKYVVEQAQKDAAQSAAAEAATASAPATVPGQGAVATGFQATGYEPSQQYSPYTMANRPSSAQPQYYGDIYQGYYPDYSAPGYTLAGNLGQWSNVAGEQARAAQPMSRAQEVTQAYLQNLGRAPETEGFNAWMQSGLSGPELQQGFRSSPEYQSVVRGNVNQMYQDIFGNQADESGLRNWTAALNRGMTQDQLKSALQQAAPTATQKDFVTQAYQDILGRAPDQAGFKNWTAAMSQGMTPEQVRAALQSSPEATSRMKMRSGGIASLI